ncbi:MAG: hypothetical protein ACOC5T_01465 [Elusimicrobiota bacterium]
MSTFEETFTTDNAEKLAQKIIDKINVLDDIIVDYDFHISKGKFIGNDRNTNTWIKFDSGDDDFLKKFVNILSDESIESTEERKLLFQEFLTQLKKILTNRFKKEFTDAIRIAVFGEGMTASNCPMEKCKINEIDIIDVPLSSKYLVKVKKQSSGGTDPLEPISSQIFSKIIEMEDTAPTLSVEELQKEINTLTKEKQEEGQWSFVEEIELKRNFCEYQLDIFVDYSMLKK